MAKKKASLGFLFWIAFILLILVIFLFNKSRIDKVLESTGFFTVVKQKIGVETQPEVKISPVEKLSDTEEKPKKEEGAQNQKVKNTQQEPEKPQLDKPKTEAPVSNSAKPVSPASGTPTATKQQTAAQKPVKSGDSVASQTPVTSSGSQKPAAEPQNTRKARLFFVLVGDDGQINLKGSDRTVSYSDSPLVSTINSLLSGPGRHEISEDLMSLIPPHTKLISASVKDGTAYLNFNEAFRINNLGVDGYIAQLKQIVYSATEFPTVKDVQFLIEGEKHQYLTAEGIFIGAPLRRDSFR